MAKTIFRTTPVVVRDKLHFELDGQVTIERVDTDKLALADAEVSERKLLHFMGGEYLLTEGAGALAITEAQAIDTNRHIIYSANPGTYCSLPAMTQTEHYGWYLGITVPPNSEAIELRQADGTTTIATLEPGESCNVWWYGSTVQLWQLGGIGGRAAKIQTEEAFTLTVDYATGSSPAAGTRVTNQAEATALGTLKYCQDVIDVLPPFVDHAVTANVALGEQYHKPGTGDIDGFTKTYMYAHPFVSTSAARDDYINISFGPGIAFIGQRASMETGIAGTWNTGTKEFTRSAGTWTVDELVGKYLYCESGANAGVKYVVLSNTATVATILGTVYTNGAGSVETYQPGTVLLPSTNGVAHDTAGISDLVVGLASTKFNYVFDTIQLGKPGFGMDITARSSMLSLQQCSVYGYVKILPVYSAKASITLTGCYVEYEDDLYGTSSPLLNLRGRETRGVLSDNLFTGDPSHGTVFDFEDQVAVFGLGPQVIRPDPAFTGTCFLIDGAGHIEMDVLVIEGNSGCVGLEFRGGESGGAGGNVGFASPPVIDDCTKAVYVRRCLGLALPEIEGTGNAIGWDLTDSSSITVDTPESVGATTEIQLDGQSVDYTDLANSGDKITGPAGSSIMRR